MSTPRDLSYLAAQWAAIVVFGPGGEPGEPEGIQNNLEMVVDLRNKFAMISKSSKRNKLKQKPNDGENDGENDLPACR